MRLPSPILRTMALVLVAGVLSACYLPERYRARVDIRKDGYVHMAYEGKLIWVPHYEAIRRGTLSGQERIDALARVEADLTRDSNFTKVRNLGDGRYEVSYKRNARLNDTMQLSFVRRQKPLLVIKRIPPEGHVQVIVPPLNEQDQERLRKGDLRPTGTLRLLTDSTVFVHNATRTAQMGDVIGYEWQIEEVDYDPPRALVAVPLAPPIVLKP